MQNSFLLYFPSHLPLCPGNNYFCKLCQVIAVHGLCLKRAVTVHVGMSHFIQRWMELDDSQVLILFIISEGENFNNLDLCIFFFFQFGGNRFYVFHVCFSADVKQNCLTIKTSFRGCLRNLVLTKGQHTELFDFNRAFDLRGVFPHSCPGAEHWTVAKPVWIERGFVFFYCWSVILHSHFVMKRRTDKNLHLFDSSGCFPTQVIFFFNQKLRVCILTKWF